MHLCCQQRECSDCFESLLLVPVEYVRLLELVRILSYFFTPDEGIAALYVIECEYLFVLLAQVTHSKVDGGAVPCRCKHGLCHDSGDVQSYLSLPYLLTLGLVTSVSIGAFLLLVVLCHSVLLLELLPCSLGKMRYRVTCQSHLCHCIEDRSIRYVVAAHKNFSVEPCLVPIDVLPSPQPYCRHRCPNVYKQ